MRWAAALVAVCAFPFAGHAFDWDRPALLDGAGSPRQELKERGISVDAWLTQFYQGIVAGEGDKEWQYGGKGDLIATFDGGKLGLWKGLYVNVHQEWLYGEDANNQGDGSLFPVNTALGFPRLGGYERDTSIIVTQAFSEQLSVSVGKFNMLDAASKTPLMGGGGLDTFMNTTFAAPISGVTPPYIVGAIGTLKTEPAIFTLMVYDPRNAQDWDVVENPFEEGTTTSLSITVPTKIGGLSGYYGVRGVYSSLDGLNLANIPQLILPPGEAGTSRRRADERRVLVRQRERAAVPLSRSQQPGRGMGLLCRGFDFGRKSQSDRVALPGRVGGQQPDPGPTVRQMGDWLLLLCAER